MDLMVQPYFATGVPELARPILGKRGDTGRGGGIANKL